MHLQTPAALGFSVHTGWAAAVIITGGHGSIGVLVRDRLQLLPDESIPRFVFHRAAELPIAAAKGLITTATAMARKASAKQLARLVTFRRKKGASEPMFAECWVER